MTEPLSRTAACGDDADGHLRAEVRADRLDLSLQTALDVTARDVELAIDAVDIPAVQAFWKAVLAYEDEHDKGSPTDALVDPTRRGPHCGSSRWTSRVRNAT